MTDEGTEEPLSYPQLKIATTLAVSQSHISHKGPAPMHTKAATRLVTELSGEKLTPIINSRTRLPVFAKKEKALLPPAAPTTTPVSKHLESSPRITQKKTPLGCPDGYSRKVLDTLPGMEDLANILQDIQQVRSKRYH